MGSCGGPGCGGKPVAANHCLLVAVAVCGSRLSCGCKVGWNCTLCWCCLRRAWKLLLWCGMWYSCVVVVVVLVPKGRESVWLTLCQRARCNRVACVKRRCVSLWEVRVQVRCVGCVRSSVVVALGGVVVWRSLLVGI